MRTIVVGAGAVGLACAHALLQRGREVVVIDQREPGGGCSKGNAGWICPSHAAPLPAPGLTWTSIKWMLRSDSPLYISPRAAIDMPRWLWRFWRACNRRDFDRGLQAMAELNRNTLRAFDQLERDGVECELHRKGLLFAFRDPAALEHSLREHDFIRTYGYRLPTRLSEDEVRRLEPALSDEVVGGFLVEEEYHVRPESLTRGYAKRLAELGAELKSGVTVTGPAVGGVATSDGRIAGDEILIAAGAWSGRLAAAFGARLPVQAGKGYSITVSDSRLTIGRPIALDGVRVACTPFEGATRFGGTMELSGINEVLDRRRIGGIRKGIAAFFRHPVPQDEGVEWVGMRPLTPDGLPLLGRVPGHRNLFVATGHAMLGVTLAPVTGAAMAALIAGGESETLAPFDPGRFQW